MNLLKAKSWFQSHLHFVCFYSCYYVFITAAGFRKENTYFLLYQEDY